ARLRHRDGHLHVLPGGDHLVDALRVDREAVLDRAFVLELEHDLLARLALEERRAEVVVVHLNLRLAARGLRAVVVRLDAARVNRGASASSQTLARSLSGCGKMRM